MSLEVIGRSARRRSATRLTREKLLGAAAAVLSARQGALEMAEVAAQAGVSVGLAYHHFGSKAGLLSAVVEAFYDRYDAVANQRMDRAEPWASRERRRLHLVIDFLLDDPLAAVILGSLGRSPEVATVESARQRAMIELAARNIEHGQRLGQIAADVDSLLAGAAIIGGIRQAATLVLESPGRLSREAVVAHLWKFIAGAVRLEGTP